MLNRHRNKLVWALLAVCIATALGWSAVSWRRRAAAEQADRLAALGVIFQRTKPWRVEQVNEWPSDLPPEEIRSLCTFPAIELLNLQGAAVTDAELAWLTALPKLETLVLGETDITDNGLSTLAKIKTLKKLSLEHAKVTKLGVRQLKQVRPDLEIEVYEATLVGLGHLSAYLPHGELNEQYELVALDLRGSAVKDRDLEPVASCEYLRMVNLSETSIGDSGIRHLGGLNRLEELWLRGTNVTDRGLQAISKLTQLRALSLAETSVSDEGLEQLAKLPRLEILHLGNTQVSDAGLASLRNLTSLKEVYVTNSLVTDEGAAAISDALPDTKVVIGTEAAPRAEDIESQVLG